MDGSAGLTVEDCTFELPDPGQANCFGAGIYATGVMGGVEITGCTVQSANPPTTVPFNDLAVGNLAEPPFQLAFGYLQVPGAAAPAPEVTPQQFYDATIEQSLFQGVTVPVLVMAQLGALRVDRNTVRSCYGGLWFVSLASPAQLPIFDQFSVGDTEVYTEFAKAEIAALRDGIFVIATAIGQVLFAAPPAGGLPEPGKIRPFDTAQLALARQKLSALLGVPAPAAGRPGRGSGNERVPAARSQRLPRRRDHRGFLFRRRLPRR